MEVFTEAVRGRTPQKEVEMNRTYEIMFIVRPDVEEVELDKLIETFSGYVTGGGGTVKTTEKMGRRRLAYTVKKFNDGFYVLLIVDAPASLISEIERRLRVSEQVIKFITVRMDEEDKRVASKPQLPPSRSPRLSQPSRRRTGCDRERHKLRRLEILVC
jgi:small subunit ribosomal protein S6